MKYKGLDGKEYLLRLKKNNGKFKSSYHKKAYELFKSIYPLYTIYEETKLCGTKNDLYVDIFCPSLQLMIEVQGAQHETFNPFFHQNIAGFAKSKGRDNEKRQWCEANGITLIELVHNESEEQWKQKILHLNND
jgi:hypothetical protein